MTDRLRAWLPARVYYGLRTTVRSPPRWLGAWRAPARRRRRVAAAARAGHGSLVQAGPFEGMRYLRQASWGEELVPKLLGCYEAELHEHLESLLRGGYDRVVNVGCAEGYYAVGLARRLPGAQVSAFDTDPRAQYLCRRLAARNDVEDRVHVGGECTPSMLDELVVGRTLVVVDCEGCELALLRPDLAPGLRRADLLVELHDFVDPSISTTIVGRFPGHDLTLVDAVDRDPARYALPGLSAAEQADALSEHRPGGMQWAVLRAPTPSGEATAIRGAAQGP